MTREVKIKKPVRVFVYSTGESRPRTAAGGSFETSLISVAGGSNVFGNIKGVSPQVTWDQVAEAAPEVIIINDFVDLKSADEKRMFIREKEELKNIPAVQNDRFLTLTNLEVFPGAQNVYAIEKMIRFFFPDAM